MRWRQSDHHVAEWHKHTHTHTHTHTTHTTHTHTSFVFLWHTHVHAHNFSVMMKRAEWSCFFFLCFLFFSLCLRVLLCHLPFISSYHVAPRHKHTMAQTNKQANTNTHSNHVCTCILALRLVSRSLVCNNLSTPLNVYGGALVYHFLEQHSFLFSFPLGSLLPFSRPSVSFSQVNPPGYYWLLRHSGI